MQRNVITVMQDMTITQVIEKVKETGRHGFPVLKDGRLVGVVSWHDTHNVAPEKRDRTRVEEIMTLNVISLTEKNNAREVLDLLDKHKIGRIVIVDSKDRQKVTGIVTRDLIIETYLKLLES